MVSRWSARQSRSMADMYKGAVRKMSRFEAMMTTVVQAIVPIW